MARRETKSLKALYFDLGINELKSFYSATNPKGAYRVIARFMHSHDFLHEQYSGYHSTQKKTDLEVFDIISEMNESIPWLKSCVKKFEVTNIGANHDLTRLLAESIEDPE